MARTKKAAAKADPKMDAAAGANTAAAPNEAAESTNEAMESRLPSPEEAKARLTGSDRKHFEGLGTPWAILLGGNPAELMPQVVGTVLKAGGTRPSWRWKTKDKENVVHDYLLMAWPKDEPVRAAVLVSGPEGGQLRPVDAFPLLQGLPNDLTVEKVHPWENGRGANVGAVVEEGYNPMWFFDPLYDRDRTDLTPGVTQTFLIAGLAFGMHKALLDELTITQGPYYEAHAQKWLEEHPGSRRLDVPPLKIPMAGRHLIFPGQSFGEYQLRARIERVEDTRLDRMDVKVVYLKFPFKEHDPLLLPVYVAKSVLKDYEPKVDDEIDTYVWLQGRIIDMENPNASMPEDLIADPAHRPAPIKTD